MQGRKRLLIQILLAVTLLVLLGHSLSRADERPQVRVVHAATGLPRIDVYINDALFFNNIVFPFVTAYAPVDPGERTLKVRPAGLSDDSPSLREVTEPYNNDQAYTSIVAGRVKDIEYWRLTDDNKLPGLGTSKVRIVHASISTPTAQFCLGDVCRTLAFKEDTGYFLLDPGVYRPKIRLNGLEVSSVTIPPLTLKDNSVHTVFMIGQLQDQPTALGLLYTLDAGDFQKAAHPQPAVAPPSNSPAMKQPTGPPPALPPVTGAFLSPRAIGVLTGVVLILLGSLGFWISRR